tara:strand:- start:1820 stop:2080 length:261 start_codon:yes stop_codon:yes gene_type:complete
MDKVPPKVVTAPKTQDSVEFGSLEVHVALSRERHEEINSRFDRVEAHMIKIEEEVDKGFEKIQKVVLWSAGTMFFTLISMFVSTLL